MFATSHTNLATNGNWDYRENNWDAGARPHIVYNITCVRDLGIGTSVGVAYRGVRFHCLVTGMPIIFH